MNPIVPKTVQAELVEALPFSFTATPEVSAALRQAQDERIVGGGLQEIPAFAGMTEKETGPRSPAFAGAGKCGVTSEGEGAAAFQFEPGHTPIFSPQAQAKFLDNLSVGGNVRHACKLARVSPQTAYRARRKSAQLAALWDAALLSARGHAEEVLATRALEGTEESVFYHGEEVATRIRYSDRLLLAHLGRLDRLAERAEVSAALHEFDDAVEALQRGEALPEILPQANSLQDSVPSVPSCRTPEEISEDERLDAMHAARPEGALKPYQLGHSIDETGEIEALQLEAFEAGVPEWWLIIDEHALDRALEAGLAAMEGEGVSCASQEESCDETCNDGERRFGAGAGGDWAAERGDIRQDSGHRRGE
uniref:hypothetical protein n=1 Tax=uncultured Altererythrobacter sp. TaxID=500840 RepID=UPI00262E68EC|nr:hypothetical protein [uncultured Altererythrobacter sp.]